MLEAENQWYQRAEAVVASSSLELDSRSKLIQRHTPHLRATASAHPQSLLELGDEAHSLNWLRISEAQAQGLRQHHQETRALHSHLERQSNEFTNMAEEGHDFRRSTATVEYMVNDEIEKSPKGSLLQRKRHIRRKSSPANAGMAVTGLSSLSSQYVGPIGVGTVVAPSTCVLSNGQALQFVDPDAEDQKKAVCHLEDESQVWVVFDTGSTNIWVSSDLCRYGACVKQGRHRYNHTRSTTYDWPQNGLELSVQFGTGCIKGPQAKDDFHIGPFTVFNQTFGMIETQNGTVFNEVPFEGILGLAFSSMSANGVKPFFDSIIQQKALRRNEFAFYFSPDSVTANAVFWGGVDANFYEGKIEYFPVVDPYYWAIELVSFKIGSTELFPDDWDRGQPVEDEQAADDTDDDGQSYDEDSDREDEDSFSESAAIVPGTVGRRGLIGKNNTSNKWKVIVDTGTTFFTAEGEMYNTVLSMLKTVKCDEMTAKSHPPLTYRLRSATGAERDFVLHNHQYMTAAGADSGSTCAPAFMRIDIPPKHGPAMVFGECFLRHFYAVFDRADGNPQHARIGLAKSRHSPHTVNRLMHLTHGQQYFQKPSHSY
jgi:hypothetical protein